jgi:hypothetical protein
VAKPATIKIDDVEYVRKDFVGSCDGPIKIAVLDRGFVYVGHVTMEGDFIVLSDARNIRKWGTSKGLGELREGPLTNTVLDFYGTVRVPLRALISFIDVEQSKWKLS